MTDRIQQQLSELVDSELPPDVARGAIDKLKLDDRLQTTWGHYHLIGDVMRGETVTLGAASIAESVRERLADEPAIIAQPKQSKPRSDMSNRSNHWFKPAVGIALAASVAGAAVVILPDFSFKSNYDGARIASQATAPAPVSPILKSPDELQVVAMGERPLSKYSLTEGTRWKNLSQPEIESKLNRFLIDHNELTSPSGMTGVIPYASFVSYDANK